MIMSEAVSNKLKHFWKVVSNVRPIVWICLYICLMPLFALVYYLMPGGQFRIPQDAGTGFGSWLYYSIVTITTLGFGDYTPAHGWAQAVTAIEVMCGLIFLGFFLNSVGSMKSEIDVESEIEKQRRVHKSSEYEKLMKNIPVLLHKLNLYLSFCYAVTTPLSRRGEGGEYNPDFSFNDMHDLYLPSGIPTDHSSRAAVEGLMACASATSLYLDSLQSRVDLTLWPELLEDSFGFVAACQMFVSEDLLKDWPERELHKSSMHTLDDAVRKISDDIKSWSGPAESGKRLDMAPAVELFHFIKETGKLARDIELSATRVASSPAISN